MKICLKCKRNLFDRDMQCDKCGCTDIMDKKEYDDLCVRFQNASDKEKEKLRQSDEYQVICKYKFIVDKNNTPEKRREQSKKDKEKRLQEERQYLKHLDDIQQELQQSKIAQAKLDKETNVPKCPTCGSTNVNKISGAKKAAGFITVGVFSSNFGKSMECKSCGYKW